MGLMSARITIPALASDPGLINAYFDWLAEAGVASDNAGQKMTLCGATTFVKRAETLTTA